MLGPAKREYKIAKEMRVVAKPRPVAMYRAPPKVKFVMIECEEICVEKTSNAGEREAKCFVRRRIALPVPRSMSSIGDEDESTVQL